MNKAANGSFELFIRPIRSESDGRSLEQVPLHRAVRRQPPLVHLSGSPVHDGGVHAVLHR